MNHLYGNGEKVTHNSPTNGEKNATEIDISFYRYDADHRFAAMYPLLVRQILEDYGTGKRTVLDIGTGGAPLPIEMAKVSDVELIGVDNNAEVLDIARQNIARHGLPPERIRLIRCEVYDIPLPDGAADLVISRGSIPFWEDLAKAFAEIHRVMAQGGTGFVGCGFSRYQPVEEVKGMRPEWSSKGKEDPRNAWKEEGRIPKALEDAGVRHFEISCGPYGYWVILSKP